MDAEGFEEEESLLKVSWQASAASQICVQTFESGTIFENLHLTEMKWTHFPLTFAMFHSNILVQFRKIFVTVKFLFYLGVKELKS